MSRRSQRPPAHAFELTGNAGSGRLHAFVRHDHTSILPAWKARRRVILVYHSLCLRRVSVYEEKISAACQYQFTLAFKSVFGPQ